MALIKIPAQTGLMLIRQFNTLTKKSVVEEGDLVVLTKGEYKDKSGGTNMMKILRVGDANY